MKPLFALIFSLLLYSFQQTNPVEELKIKTNKVRARLINGEPLPESIRNLDALTFDKPDSLQHDFEYWTTRTENNILDTVTIILTTRSDSLMHFDFSEQYLENGRQGKAYFYTVNKYGVIDYAYREDAPKDTIQPTPIYHSDGTVFIPMNTEPIYEINIRSQISSLRNPDKKTIEMYNARLKMVIDKLYDILFKQ